MLRTLAPYALVGAAGYQAGRGRELSALVLGLAGGYLWWRQQQARLCGRGGGGGPRLAPPRREIPVEPPPPVPLLPGLPQPAEAPGMVN